MLKFFNFALWASIVIYSLWILSAILGMFVEFECTDSTICGLYKYVGIFGLLFLAVFIIIKVFKDTDSNFVSFVKVTVIIIPVMVLTGVLLLFFSLSELTQSYIDGVCFVNKKDSSVKIARRVLPMGDIDESEIRHLFRVKELTNYLTWIQTEIDTNTIDKREWIRQ